MDNIWRFKSLTASTGNFSRLYINTTHGKLLTSSMLTELIDNELWFKSFNVH